MNGYAAPFTMSLMRIALALLLVVTVTFGTASAAPTSIETSAAPVVNVALSNGRVIVKTWASDRVLVTSQSGVTWSYLAPDKTIGGIPKLISINAQRVAKGGKVGRLASEVFQLPHLAGTHDLIRVVGAGNVTLTIPVGSPIVVIRVGHGSVSLRGYRGTFFVNARAGSIRLTGVSGTGFAQALHGTVVALDSSFDRIRARNGTGRIVFERCVARQIVATSALGDVAFDNGSLHPGLARFETKYGNVALGIGSGGATVRAHSKTGAVRTTFASAKTASADPPPHDADIAVGGGGARVTASSQSGSIYIFSGSIAQHPSYARVFPAIAKLLSSHADKRRPGTSSMSSM